MFSVEPEAWQRCRTSSKRRFECFNFRPLEKHTTHWVPSFYLFPEPNVAEIEYFDHQSPPGWTRVCSLKKIRKNPKDPKDPKKSEKNPKDPKKIRKIRKNPKNPKKSQRSGKNIRKIQKIRKNPKKIENPKKIQKIRKNPKFSKNPKNSKITIYFFWGFKIRSPYLGVNNPSELNSSKSPLTAPSCDAKVGHQRDSCENDLKSLRPRVASMSHR